MAMYKVRSGAKLYQTSADVERVINYITSPDKTQTDGIIGGAVLPENAAEAMNTVATAYRKESGPRIRHSILSFSPEEPISARQVKEIAKECAAYYKDKYQILAGVHEDCDHLHVHFAMNTTSYVDGTKYHGTKADYYGFLKHISRCLETYGLDVIPEK